MMQQPFDRRKYVYHNNAFVELVKDAVRFFNGTPVHSLPPPEHFSGTGVYVQEQVFMRFITQEKILFMSDMPN